MAVNQDQIKQIAAQFEEAWNGQDRPWISDFLNQIDPIKRDALLYELIRVDIVFRKKNGETPRPVDYQQLGRDAVNVAFQGLHESFDFIESGNDLARTSLDPKELDCTEGFTSDQAESLIFDESPIEFVGPYKLLQKIGEGGMGSVWMAEQQEPVRRRVALKLIRADVGSRDAVVRFEAERQAIAIMDHQNIATILDAGTTDSGSPYFVMELVNGMPLDKYCDNQRLDFRQRLELMIPVCRAIQHAHQKGIIHRDLKHSNVLVTRYDGQPVPKVIDFGLAKAFEQQATLTDKTMNTEFGRVVGTLQYMSPEQAEMNVSEVDTRSDIYSLGVMVYKLLTGTTPLINEAIGSNSFLQLLQQIREEDSPLPSVRVASYSDEELAKFAKRRNIKPEKLAQAVTGDLEWIVMKAIDKDRSRRYQTANGLAMDIERYLRNDEVSARPPSTAYRLQKFYKRNQRLVAAMVLLSVALLLGIVGTSIGLFLALDQRNRANLKTSEAKIEAKNAQFAAQEARKAEARAEGRLHAIRIKSAWSDWQLGNVESAWRMLNSLREGERGWESQFLATEFVSSQQILYGHAMAIEGIDASTDGKFLATTSRDQTVRIWDAQTKQLMFRHLIQESPTAIRFSPSSRLIACADRSNRITIWDVQSGARESELGPFAEDITCMKFFDDENKMVVGTAAGDSRGFGSRSIQVSKSQPMIRVLSLENASTESEWAAHSRDITGLDCTTDGRVIVSCSLDSTVRMWILDGDRYLPGKILECHAPGVLSVALSPDEKYFASCGKDTTIRLWDLESGGLSRMLIGHDDEVHAIRFSNDGTRIVSASADRTARIWNRAGTELLSLQGHYNRVVDACFSADDQEIYSASYDSTVRVWNSRTKPSTTIVGAHKDVIWCADFSPDGKRLVTASEDKLACIIDVATGQILGDKILHDSAVLSVSHSPVGDLFVTGAADGKIRVFNSVNGQLLHTIAAHQDFIWDVEFSPDGQLVATGSSDYSVKIWNTSDWKLITTIPAHSGEIASVRFSTDGKWMVTSSDDMLVKLWDRETFSLVHTFEGHRNTIWRAVFSPDGKMIASSSYDGEIILWDVARRRKIRMIDAHQNQIAGLAFSADGSRIVSASDDQTMKIWEVRTGIELFVLRDKSDTAIVHASFSTDGSKLVSGNKDGWITIRSARVGEMIHREFLPQNAVELITDGSIAVTAHDATVRVFERELANASKCCEFYPSFHSFTIRGITQFRLGHFSEAVESLLEAQRLEPIEYGEPDVRPDIEGYLVLASLADGQVELARKNRLVFEQKSSERLWTEDQRTQNLRDEVAAAFKILELKTE